MMFRSALCEPENHGLPKFQHVYEATLLIPGVDPYRDERPRSETVANTLPLFYLPSIRHIATSIANSAQLDWPPRLPEPSSLVSLHVRELREKPLTQLLGVTRSLSTLRWDWFHEPDNPDPWDTTVIELGQIATGLSKVGATLEVLVISADCSQGCDPELPPLQIRGSLDVIAEFSKLTHLEVCLPFLYGGFSLDLRRQLKDVVPRSIESLAFTNDLWQTGSYEWTDTDLLSLIQVWLEGKETFAPHLRDIKLILREMDDGSWGSEIRNELEQACLQAGVKLEIIDQVNS